MPDDELLKLSNKVHVLSTEVSHLDAQIERIREERKRREKAQSQRQDDIENEIEDIWDTVDTLEKRIRDIQNWVQNEAERLEIEDKQDRKRTFARWKDKRKWIYGVVLALISGLLGFLLRWLTVVPL